MLFSLQLSTVTTDNASNNGTFIKEFQSHLIRQGIKNFDSMHIRCLLHITNLSVQDFLAEIKCSPNDEEDDFEPLYDEDIGVFTGTVVQKVTPFKIHNYEFIF